MAVSTQDFLEISDIRDDVVILKDKSLRGILIVSSLNFVLKSEEEQTIILNQFQNFLNSLDFSCQIIIQSQRLNLTGYLEKLKVLEKKQPTELLKAQTKNYHDFISGILASGTIMVKNFYLVVPFYPVELIELKGGTSGEEDISKKSKSVFLDEKLFQRSRIQLFQRMEFLMLGLLRCGLNSVAMRTEELIELFWSFYHPKEAEMGYYPSIPSELIKQHGIPHFQKKETN